MTITLRTTISAYNTVTDDWFHQSTLREVTARSRKAAIDKALAEAKQTVAYERVEADPDYRSVSVEATVVEVSPEVREASIRLRGALQAASDSLAAIGHAGEALDDPDLAAALGKTYEALNHLRTTQTRLARRTL